MNLANRHINTLIWMNVDREKHKHKTDVMTDIHQSLYSIISSMSLRVEYTVVVSV